MNSCFIHDYYSYCNCNGPRTPTTNPPGLLIYRLGSDCYQRPLPENRYQTLWIRGDRYRAEKARLGYVGPEDCEVDYTDYWLAEAQKGSDQCWIDTWHPAPYYAKFGENACNPDLHPDWGKWTTNKPV